MQRIIQKCELAQRVLECIDMEINANTNLMQLYLVRKYYEGWLRDLRKQLIKEQHQHIIDVSLAVLCFA